MSSKALFQGYLLLLITILGFGFITVLVDLARTEVDPLNFLTYRFVLASLLWTPYVFIYRRTELSFLLKHPTTYLFAISQVSTITFQYLSQIFISPSVTTIISKSYLISVPFIVPLVLQENFDRKAAFVAPIGAFRLAVVMVSKSGQRFTFSLLGLILSLLSSLGSAFRITYSSKISRQMKPDNWSLLYVMVTSVAISSVVLKAIFDPTISGFSLTVWGYLLFLIFIPSYTAYFAFLYALRSVPASTASVLLLSETFVPFVSDFLRGREEFNIIFVVGSIIFSLHHLFLSISLTGNIKNWKQ